MCNQVAQSVREELERGDLVSPSTFPLAGPKQSSEYSEQLLSESEQFGIAHSWHKREPIPDL